MHGPLNEPNVSVCSSNKHQEKIGQYFAFLGTKLTRVRDRQRKQQCNTLNLSAMDLLYVRTKKGQRADFPEAATQKQLEQETKLPCFINTGSTMMEHPTRKHGESCLLCFLHLLNLSQRENNTTHVCYSVVAVTPRRLRRRSEKLLPRRKHPLDGHTPRSKQDETFPLLPAPPAAPLRPPPAVVLAFPTPC